MNSVGQKVRRQSSRKVCDGCEWAVCKKKKDYNLPPIKMSLLSPLGACCAVVANSSVCSLLFVLVALKDFGDSPFQCTWVSAGAILNLSSRQVFRVPLESPRAQWPGSTLAKSPYPSVPTCKTRSMRWRPYSRPSSSSLTTRRTTFPRSGTLLSLIQMNWGHGSWKEAQSRWLWGEIHL